MTTSIKTSETLDLVSPGNKCVVRMISPKNRALMGKLLAMGMVAGTQVEVVKAAPLGCPIKIRALGYELSLRLEEAQSVTIVPA